MPLNSLAPFNGIEDYEDLTLKIILASVCGNQLKYKIFMVKS
jgi:hypothetical protein